MGLHRIADKQRDYYLLSVAAKHAHALNFSERHTEQALKWTYLIEVSKDNPDYACIKVFDEENKFVGYWYH